MQPAFVSAAKIAATLTPALRATDGVITITGTGDHLRPEWPITITGMRSRCGPLPRYRQSPSGPSTAGAVSAMGQVLDRFRRPRRAVGNDPCRDGQTHAR